MRGADDLPSALVAALVWLVPAVLAVGVVYATAVVVAVRLLSIRLRAGMFPVRSRIG